MLSAPTPRPDHDSGAAFPPSQAEPWLRLAFVLVAPILLLLVGILLNR